MRNRKLEVGVEICDTHYGEPSRNKDLLQWCEVRNEVMFKLQREDSQPNRFGLWLTGIARSANRFYTNKMLLVVSEPWRDSGWSPCAWSYDGNYAGMCEVRVKKEK